MSKHEISSIIRLHEDTVLFQLPTMVDAFRVVEPLVGANNSTQYFAVIGYE
jgi:hypothetical protein